MLRHNTLLVLFSSSLIFGICAQSFIPQWRFLFPNDGNSSLWPSTREHGASAFDPESNRFFQFGGRTSQKVDPHKVVAIYLQDFSMYDVANNTWISLPSLGSVPSPRTEASALYHAGHIFVFGGVGPIDYSHVDGSVFFCEVGTTGVPTSPLNWTQVSSPLQPGGRKGHTAIVYQDSMIVFGGHQPIPKSAEASGTILFPPFFFDELYSFSLVEPYTWSPLEQSNLRPKGRTSHSAALLHDRMYIFGGATRTISAQDQAYRADLLNDLWAYDFLSHNWINLTQSIGVPPSPRESHAAAFDVTHTFMLIFGGRFGLNIYNDLYKYFWQDNHWETVFPSYPAAPPRFGHSLFPSRQEDFFLVTSGMLFTGQQTNDVGELYVKDGWVNPPDGPIVINPGGITTLLHFPLHAPSHSLVTFDECGDPSDENFLQIQFETLREVDVTWNTIQRIDFMGQSYEIDSSHAGAILNLQDKPLTLQLIFHLLEEENVINYADSSFAVASGENKFSLILRDWIFLHPTNHLELDLAFNTGSRPFHSLYRTINEEEKRVIYRLASSSMEAKVAISTVADINGDVVDIHHRWIFNASRREYKLRFEFPFFIGNLTYDPDFGATVQEEDAGECGGLTELQIAGIVVGSVVPCCALVFGAAFGAFSWFRWRVKRDEKRRNAISISLGPEQAEEMANIAGYHPPDLSTFTLAEEGEGTSQV